MKKQRSIAKWAKETQEHEQEFERRPPSGSAFPQSEAGAESVVTVKPSAGPSPAAEYLAYNAQMASRSPNGAPPVPDFHPMHGRMDDKRRFGNGVPNAPSTRSRSVAPMQEQATGHKHDRHHRHRGRSHSPSGHNVWAPQPEYVAYRGVQPTQMGTPYHHQQQQRFQQVSPASGAWQTHYQHQQSVAPVTYGAQTGYAYAPQAPQGGAGYYRGPAPYQVSFKLCDLSPSSSSH
jgi:hypothetical protein